MAILAAPAPLLLSQDSQSADEEVFELSPFEVSTSNDRGYLSTNAISGTSLNTAIRDLPMPLEVINRELIDDLQADDLKETLEYSAGVYTQSFENTTGANEGRFSDNSPSSSGFSAFTNTISLRGYTVPNNQRFGFRVGAIVPAYNVILGGSTDSVATERVEVVRGPQALLYGINVLSGVVNIIPKEPLFDPAYRASISAGSYGYRRASFDATGPIIKQKLAYRFLTAYTEEDHWSMFQHTEKEDYALQFKWRITPHYDLFVEATRAYYHRDGIGPRYFTDNDRTGQNQYEWENEWGETHVFGRDDVTLPAVGNFGDLFESPFVARPDVEYPEKLFDYGNDFRISGPDTYYDREETTFTALLRAKFTDNLSGEFGIYHVEQEDETFNVNLRTLNVSRGTTRPTNPPSGFFGRPPTERNITPAMAIWFQNPEISQNGTYTPLDLWEDEAYAISQGTGDPFVFPTFQYKGAYPTRFPDEIDQDFDDTRDESWSRRFARYVWFRDRNEATSTQMRARLVYNFDWDILNVPANHTISAGANYIEDVVTFNTANVSQDDDNHVYSSYNSVPEEGRQGSDPYYLRQTVFDFTPLRYSGENVAILARPRFNRLADFGSGGASGKDGSTIARSGSKEASLWYRGYYALYQGKFWDDRFHFIGGFRQDQYQVKEEEDLMIIDQLRASDVWQGSEDPITPWYIGNGRGEYVSPEGIPDELDARVREDYAHLQELQPEGTVEYNFPEYQKFNTSTFGFSWRVIDPVSVYYLYSEGVFPNTGQRDGNFDPIDAEQTVNNEIGIKFDLMDGKISGTLSFFRIERENAVFYWNNAPNPSVWYGGVNGPQSQLSSGGPFSPAVATGPGSPYMNGAHWPVTYGVAMDYVEQAFEEMGMSDQFPNQGGSFRSDAFVPWGAHVDGVTVRYGSFIFQGYDRMYLYVEDDALQNNPDSAVLRRAFEIARATADPIGLPIRYAGGSDEQNNNASNNLGSNVTFGELGQGVDGQLIFSPIPNYQIVFSYSYQDREVTDFNLVDPIDRETGINWGTEWDAWVYLLGVENFTDPTRPSTFTGGEVKGLNLSFTPKYSAKLWNMYRFSDGPLEGLRIGGGIQYIGSAPTSVPIGGARLAENLFTTPDTPDRFLLDLSTSYSWDWKNIEWFINLRISNLLDETSDTVEVSYDGLFDTVEKRRTRIYYSPRTWRLSLTARF